MTKQTMKAIGLSRYLPISEVSSLFDLEIDKPVPIGRDLLVNVKAISVNPVDVKVRSPKPKVEETPKVLGWDVAGVVVEVGSDCKIFQPGDEVYYAGSITRQGGNSEFHLVDERIVGRKPKNLNFAEAAALPLTAITAWEALFDRLAINRDPFENNDKTLLLIGAAGGVGSIAIQLAKLAGLTVIGTASRVESIKWIEDLGVDFTINHIQRFKPQLDSIGYKFVDYILCLNSTDQHWENIAESIVPQGKICTIVGSSQALDVNILKDKSAIFAWEYMFTRPMFETEDMIEQHILLERLTEMIEADLIRTTLTERLEPINAENLRLAHAKVESGKMIGKIVLENF